MSNFATVIVYGSYHFLPIVSLLLNLVGKNKILSTFFFTKKVTIKSNPVVSFLSKAFMLFCLVYTRTKK